MSAIERTDSRTDEQTTRPGHQTLALSAADTAEGVLQFFEAVNPNDKRPRHAIAAARAWALGKIKTQQARDAAFAAHSAARSVDCWAACAAARAAGHAAATAHVPTHARHASTYALKAMSATRDQVK